jgi:hypothetical protein
MDATELTPSAPVGKVMFSVSRAENVYVQAYVVESDRYLCIPGGATNFAWDPDSGPPPNAPPSLLLPREDLQFLASGSASSPRRS